MATGSSGARACVSTAAALPALNPATTAASAIPSNAITGQANPGYNPALANNKDLVDWFFKKLSTKQSSRLFVGEAVAELRAAGVRLGVSTHDAAELDRALALAPDYVALGPIYPTLLKQMPWAPQGLARVGEWKRRIGTIPLVGIGGLTPERARAVLAAGADSAAVVTDILRHPDPEARTRAWVAATRATS